MSYRIISKIGMGGSGEVFLAENEQRKLVAIKKCKQPCPHELLGANILKQLDSKHVPKIYETFTDENYFYIVMTYYPVPSLIQAKNQLSCFQLFSLMLAFIEVERKMQKLKCTMNDIKPENIIYYQHRFYFIDFGSCDPHSRFGSKPYASPEWLAYKDVNWQSDLYSLAKTIEYLKKNNHPLIQYFLKQSLQMNAENRYHSLFHFYLFALFSKYHLILLCMLCLLLPLREMSYQIFLSQKNYEIAIKIKPNDYRSFEAILEEEGASINTFQKLEKFGLKKIKQQDFKKKCMTSLMKLDNCDLLISIDHTHLDQIKDLKSLLQYINHHPAYLEILSFYLSSKQLFFGQEGYELLKQKEVSSEYLVQNVIAYKELSLVKDCLALMEQRGEHYYAAFLYLYLFDGGDYQLDYLQQAKEHLDVLTTQNQLKDIVEKRLKQWQGGT